MEIKQEAKKRALATKGVCAMMRAMSGRKIINIVLVAALILPFLPASMAKAAGLDGLPSSVIQEGNVGVRGQNRGIDENATIKGPSPEAAEPKNPSPETPAAFCSIETHKDGENPFLYHTTLKWKNLYEEWFLLYWGDEAQTGVDPVGFRGPSGKETWDHVYNPGTWEQWSNVNGPGGTGGCTNTVTVEEPAPPPPAAFCSIETHKDGENPFLYHTTLKWKNLYEEWFLLYWGDEAQTGVDPVGFRGPSGKETWDHVYNPGTWEQWSNVNGPGGTGGCTNTVTVEPQQIAHNILPPKSFGGPAADPVIPQTGCSFSPNGKWEVCSRDGTLWFSKVNGAQEYTMGTKGENPLWLDNWSILAEGEDGNIILTDRLATFVRNLKVEGKTIAVSVDGEWVKYGADGQTWIVSIHGAKYGNNMVSAPIFSCIVFPGGG